MKKIILIALIAIFVSSCSSMYKSYPIESIPKNNTKTTIYYSIPTSTEVVFEVAYTKLIRQKGIFANKSNLLGVKNVILNDEVIYSVKDINISTKPQHEPIQQFALLLYNDNLIVEKSTIGTLKSIKLKTKEVAKEDCGNYNNNSFEQKFSEQKNIQNQIQANQSLPTKPIFETRLQQKGMLEKMNLTAEEVITRIEHLRDKQIDILSSGLDGTYINATIDFMYKQLDEIIDGYVSLFTGTETIVEETFIYNLVPHKPLISEEDLVLQLSNSPIPLLARFHTNNQTESIINRSVVMDKTDSSLVVNLKNKEISGIDGVYYSIPEQVQVSVETPKKTYSSTVELNQYGIIKSFNSQKQNIFFDIKTGGIKAVR